MSEAQTPRPSAAESTPRPSAAESTSRPSAAASELLQSATAAVDMAREAGAQDAWAALSRDRSINYTFRDGKIEKVEESTSRNLAAGERAHAAALAAQAHDIQVLVDGLLETDRIVPPHRRIAGAGGEVDR